MGVGFSLNLKPEEVEEMRRGTHFSGHEIRRLYQRFSRLDKEGIGHITKKELSMIPELAVNPLMCRIIPLFDQKKTGLINFKEFLQALNVFHSKTDHKDKLQFSFKIYDVNNDGYICSEDLFHIFKLLVGDNIQDKDLMEIVTQSIKESDQDNDGKLSLSEFEHVLILDHFDIDNKLAIDF